MNLNMIIMIKELEKRTTKLDVNCVVIPRPRPKACFNIKNYCNIKDCCYIKV